MILPNLIYLASPYSHPEKYMQVARFSLVCKVAAKLMKEGKYVFSPIAHCHPIAQMGELPEGWEYWEGYDRAMLACCDKVVVLRLPGWDTSKGVRGEIEIATNHGQPVEYMDYDLTPTIEQVIQMTKVLIPPIVAGVAISYDSEGKPSV